MKSEKVRIGAGLALARQRLDNHVSMVDLEGEVLLAHLLDKPRTWVLAHPEAEIPEEIYREYVNHLNRLATGEPLPYLLGRQEFYGIELEVNPDVLIPRPETELLVEEAIQWLRNHPGRRNGVDVGTGSGCIAAALLIHIIDMFMTVTDISQPALETAGRNFTRLGVENRVKLIKTDLLKEVNGTFDLICANLPYIPTKTLTGLDVIKYEPRLALDGGPDGLDLVREFFRQASSRLAGDGLLLAEIEAGQGKIAAQAARECFPSKRVEVLKDLRGMDRLVRVT